MRVARKSGLEEEFVREKIVVAIVKAGGNLGIARKIALEVESALSAIPVVTTEQIKIEILNRLKTIDPKTYQSWLEYDRQNGKE